VPAVIGLILGGLFIFALDQLLPHLHPEFPDEAQEEGPHSGWRRAVLLMVAITIHNFPEGLAVGVAFGADNPGAALALALGIGLQNIPEGLAIALPLRREGMGRLRAFWYGQLSATVEPIAGVLGCGLVLVAQPILPYAMAFAAGAMLYVVVEELLPETTRQGNTDVLSRPPRVARRARKALSARGSRWAGCGRTRSRRTRAPTPRTQAAGPAR
jgi:ZIP family zinc transporter